MKDRRGAIATQFAILAVPLVLAAGVAVDLSRVSNVRGQVQDIADSAALAGAYQFTTIDGAAQTAAEAAAAKYISTMGPNLPDHPSVRILAPVSSASCSLSAPPATAGTVVAQVCATTATSPNYIGTVQVAISYGVKTTLVAMVTPSINTSELATAQGGVARQANVSVSNFNTSASDLDQIYYYAAPTDNGGNLLTGQALYEYDPTTAISNNATQNSSTPILSNAKGFTNQSSIVLQVPYGSRPAFALYNTIGGVSNYSQNCYGMKSGTSNAQKKYFSTREAVPANAPTTTQYYDYQASSFSTQPNTTSGSGRNQVTNVMCSNSKGSNVTVTGGTDSYTQMLNCTSSCSKLSLAAGNYLYTWGSSRNPLQYGNLNRDSNGIPTGGTSDGALVTDCSQGTVTYNWDDNGGTGDDNDFNDIVFSVNCQTTTILNTSVRLLK